MSKSFCNLAVNLTDTEYCAAIRLDTWTKGCKITHLDLFHALGNLIRFAKLGFVSTTDHAIAGNMPSNHLS